MKHAGIPDHWIMENGLLVDAKTNFVCRFINKEFAEVKLYISETGRVASILYNVKEEYRRSYKKDLPDDAFLLARKLENHRITEKLKDVYFPDYINGHLELRGTNGLTYLVNVNNALIRLLDSYKINYRFILSECTSYKGNKKEIKRIRK